MEFGYSTGRGRKNSLSIYKGGRAISATARHRRCCNGWRSGFAVGCEPPSGSNGSGARCGLLGSASGTSDLTLRHRPPVVPTALGGWRTVPPCPWPSRLLTSTRSVFRDCWMLFWLNRAEPPDADPHVRWCGRGGEVTLPPMPISESCVNLRRNSRRRLRYRTRRGCCRGLIQDPVMDGEQRQFQPVRHADLVVDVAQIVLDDLFGRAEL